MKNSTFIFTFFVLSISVDLHAQIKTAWIDTTTHKSRENAFFFTNRPRKLNKDGKLVFKNKFTKQTNRLYFGMLNYKEDSIYVKYQAENTSTSYPTEKIEDNLLGTIFNYWYEEKDINRVIIVVPGYSKTFKEQVYDYIYRLKEIYADTLSKHTAIITYAWGNEWRPEMYYRAKRSARRAANDFAIFQHMLEDYVTDSIFQLNKPDNFKITLMCSSMGNQLLKKYLLQREKQGIELKKVYNSILFVGSDASWDSFEEGKGFHNINQLTDTVSIFVNRRDGALTFSQILNPKSRMGLVGPKNEEKLPAFIKVYNISNIISSKDILGLGHDYLLRNPVVKEEIIKSALKNDK